MRTVPTRLKILRGNPGQRRIGHEPEPVLIEEPPEPPRILRGDALAEWHRVVSELVRLRMLTAFDLQTLAIYCQLFGRWMMAEDAVIALADSSEGPAMDVLNRNALIKTADSAAMAMLSAAREFGFTPVARTRLASFGLWGGGKPPSKFKGLLAVS
jgi:P27 family predicted phage terminase small subunit